LIIHGAVYPPSGTVVQRKVFHNDSAQLYPVTGCTSTSSTPRYDTITDVGFGFVRMSNSVLFAGTTKRIYLPGRKGSFVDHSNSTLNSTFNDPIFTSGLQPPILSFVLTDFIAGQVHTYSFCAKAISSTDAVDPKITLVWTDRVDTTQSTGALVNNLDLNVSYKGVNYYGIVIFRS
jgi:hypothetical protein